MIFKNVFSSENAVRLDAEGFLKPIAEETDMCKAWIIRR